MSFPPRPSRHDPIQQLPVPGEDAIAHSERLIVAIRQAIEAAGGRLPFHLYMEQALYAPGLGYYTAGAQKFGPAGDFVTAPDISPLFARCLARQAVQLLDVLGGGELLEFGAGSGRLAADLLAELERLDRLPERYRIIELSPDLRERQRETIAAAVPGLMDRVEWLDTLPEAGFRGVVIANELLDAMPVHRFRIGAGGIEEQFVIVDGERFALAWGEPRSPGLVETVGRLQASLPGPLPGGYESELNLRAGPWLREIAHRIEAGALILIDYGHTRADYYHPERHQGTLLCHYRHRAHPDPLLYPGLQDITAHVDFTALAEAALTAGLQVCGYTTQAFFLMGCGLDELVTEGMAADPGARLDLLQGVKRLTLPTEMGERFKVIGMAKGIDGPLIGFRLRDLRERL